MAIENPTQFLRIGLILLVCILSVVLGSLIPAGDLRFPIFSTALSVLVVGVWLFPAWMTLLCVVFTMLPGRSGLGVGYLELLALSLIARWLLIVPFRGGLFGKLEGKFTFMCIAGITGILIFHSAPAWLGIGVGRRLVFVAGAVLLFCYALLAGKVDLRALPWLPWFGLVPGLISTAFELVNLVVPSSLPITYFIYTAQNWEAMAEYGGAQFDFVRLAGLRELGMGVTLLSLSYFAMDRRFALRRFFTQVGAVISGALLILIAGFRGYIICIAIATVLACFVRSKKVCFLACICGLIFVGGLIFTQSHIISLPLSVQRSLSFLPGDWDWRTKETADHGIGWRAEIRQIFFTQIFPHSWPLGRGQTQAGEIENMSWMMKDSRYQTEYFVLAQNYHSGLASSLDFVGVIGTALLVAAMIRGGFNCWWLYRHRRIAKPWHVWVSLFFLCNLPTYWYTGFFNTIFPFFCIFMALIELARADIARAIEAESFKSRVTE